MSNTGQSAQPPGGAIDYWCNAFTPDRLTLWQRAIANQGLTLAVEREGDEFCQPEQMVERLDATGFATVIIPVAGSHPGAVVPQGLPEGAPVDNFDQIAASKAEIADLATQYPGRFAGMWSIDPSVGADAVDEAEQMAAQPWCVALHNHTHSWDRPFDHADFTPFYELAAKHDLPFVMQAGASGGRFPSECGRPESIAGPAEAYPSVKFVMSHTGWPWTDETIDVVKRYPNVYLGTATWPRRRWPQKLLDFLNGEGCGQTMFATGFPTTGHNQLARQLSDPELALPTDVLQALTSTTARTVFTRLPERYSSRKSY